MFYTYLWLREDGTPYYAGKGSGKRAFERHRIGKAPETERIVLQEFDSETDAFEAEKFLIAFYGRRDLKTGCLWNLTDGGDGASGHVHSEESKQLMSRIVKQRPISEEQLERIRRIQKISPGMTGKKQSEKCRKILDRTGCSPWNKGKAHSAATRTKMSIAKLGTKWSAARREACNRAKNVENFASLGIRETQFGG